MGNEIWPGMVKSVTVEAKEFFFLPVSTGLAVACQFDSNYFNERVVLRLITEELITKIGKA